MSQFFYSEDMFKGLFSLIKCPFISTQLYEEEKKKHHQILKKMFANKDSIIEYLAHFDESLDTYLHLQQDDAAMQDNFISLENINTVKFLNYENKQYFLVCHITHLCMIFK
jgi:hypothetical protein